MDSQMIKKENIAIFVVIIGAAFLYIFESVSCEPEPQPIGAEVHIHDRFVPTVGDRLVVSGQQAVASKYIDDLFAADTILFEMGSERFREFVYEHPDMFTISTGATVEVLEIRDGPRNSTYLLVRTEGQSTSFWTVLAYYDRA